MSELNSTPSSQPISQPTVSVPPRVPQPQPKHHTLLRVVGGVALLAIGVIIGLSASRLLPFQPQVQPTFTPSTTPTPLADPTANWKTYTNTEAGFSLKHPSYNPVKKFSAPKTGEGIFLISTIRNFDSKKTSLCETYQESICLIPGKNWGQNQDIENITLDNRPAVSFYLSVLNQSGNGTSVLHVIQTKDEPLVEIALAVDGAGLEETFDQILSTFKFTSTPTTTGATGTPKANVKTLTYSLPTGWQTVQDATGQFEVGYDPSTMQTKIEDTTIYIDKPKTTPGTWQFMMVKLLPYSGGSRHQFIYDGLGENPQQTDSLIPDYHEVEYRLNNRSCLFLIGIGISQYSQTWGMCEAGGGQAFLMWSYDRGNYETVLQTLRKL